MVVDGDGRRRRRDQRGEPHPDLRPETQGRRLQPQAHPEPLHASGSCRRQGRRGPRQPVSRDYLGALKSTEADLAAFPALKLEKSKAALADLENSYEAFKASDDRVITLVGQGKIAEAQKVTLGESTEAATKAADASDALIAAVQTRVDDAVAANASAKTTASLVMLGVALLVAALLVTLALWIARGILVAVNSVRATLEAMGRGDLTVPAQATTQDEVGRMALAAEATRASMQDVMAQVGDASTTVATASEELTAVSS